jgi:hypothetical protein
LPHLASSTFPIISRDKQSTFQTFPKPTEKHGQNIVRLCINESASLTGGPEFCEGAMLYSIVRMSKDGWTVMGLINTQGKYTKANNTIDNNWGDKDRWNCRGNSWESKVNNFF